MSFPFRLPVYQKVARAETGVLSEVSGAQLYQLVKAGSRGDLSGLSTDKNKRQAQLFARMQANAGETNLAKYVSCDAKGNLIFTEKAEKLIKTDKRKKTILGAVRTFASPTIIGALAVHKAYQERRDDDKFAATDVSSALRKEIYEAVKECPTKETVTGLMDKYGLSEHDVVTLSANRYGEIRKIEGLYPPTR